MMAQACRQEPHWAARYRLDALMPQPGRIVNLSHLLLGHGGDLGLELFLDGDNGGADGLLDRNGGAGGFLGGGHRYFQWWWV